MHAGDIVLLSSLANGLSMLLDVCYMSNLPDNLIFVYV